MSGTPPTAAPTTATAKRGGRGGFALWATLLGVYWAVLFTGTHLPTPEAVVGNLMDVDKLLHFGAYFVLATLACVTVRRAGVGGRWTVVAATLAYGAFDEITQPLVGRTCHLADWLANAAGVGAAVLLDYSRKR